MKRFVFKVLFFSSTTIGFLLLFTYSGSESVNPAHDYMASIIDKHNRLDSIQENRLVLVGGSNLAFGIDGKLIEDSLGVNVVNLGLHAGLGFNFMINEAFHAVQPGDVLLLSFEYGIYSDAFKPYYDLIHHTQKIYSPSKQYYFLGPEEILSIIFLDLRRRSIYFQNLKSRNNERNEGEAIDNVYSRNAFNMYGDVESHILDSAHYSLNDRGRMAQFTINSRIKPLKKLYYKCVEKGAKVYIVYPCYPKSEFENNKEVIHRLHSQLVSEETLVPVLCNPELFIFDDSLFFDTVYHLNGVGRKRRTETLISLLSRTVFKEI